MNSSELYEAFRQEIVDTVKPYLWSDDEVKRYGADAHRMFVRLTGGIADFTSDATKVQLSAGEAFSQLHPSILRIMSANKVSDGYPVQIVNKTDISRMRTTDYGQIKPLLMDNKRGNVRYGVIGMEKDLVRWVQIPDVDDEVQLEIYRLPLSVITDDGQEIEGVDEEHHFHLIEWMKHLAYKKPDAEAFNQRGSENAEAAFRGYCQQVKAEWERYKHKTREVVYGGL